MVVRVCGMYFGSGGFLVSYALYVRVQTADKKSKFPFACAVCGNSYQFEVDLDVCIDYFFSNLRVSLVVSHEYAFKLFISYIYIFSFIIQNDTQH